MITLIPDKVKKWGRVYEEKEIRTEVGGEFEPMNLNPL